MNHDKIKKIKAFIYKNKFISIWSVLYNIVIKLKKLNKNIDVHYQIYYLIIDILRYKQFLFK
jgi:hypothetical protein